MAVKELAFRQNKSVLDGVRVLPDLYIPSVQELYALAQKTLHSDASAVRFAPFGRTRRYKGKTSVGNGRIPIVISSRRGIVDRDEYVRVKVGNDRFCIQPRIPKDMTLTHRQPGLIRGFSYINSQEHASQLVVFEAALRNIR